jgi:TRAP-type mannitol/chloroaromatic compound transport system permease large subunit
MKGVAPPEVSMGDIYRSILPFILMQLAVVIFILLYPGVVMWLPDLLF